MSVAPNAAGPADASVSLQLQQGSSTGECSCKATCRRQCPEPAERLVLVCVGRLRELVPLVGREKRRVVRLCRRPSPSQHARATPQQSHLGSASSWPPTGNAAGEAQGGQQRRQGGGRGRRRRQGGQRRRQGGQRRRQWQAVCLCVRTWSRARLDSWAAAIISCDGLAALSLARSCEPSMLQKFRRSSVDMSRDCRRRGAGGRCQYRPAQSAPAAAK